MTGPVSTAEPDRELQVCLEKIFAQVRPGSQIATVSRKRSSFESWYAVEILTLETPAGEELSVFLKDFGTFNRPKEGMRERRDRELAVYRDLLADAKLGTATYYGSLWDEDRGRFWLFLEFVPGMPIRYRQFEEWIPAARWLARMQAHFAVKAAELDACGVLARHDPRFFEPVAEEALESASRVVPEAGKQLRRIVDRYSSVVDVLVGDARTFVHGAYRPGQILLDSELEPSRICPVDWELAAIGSPLFDFAELSDGFDLPQLAVLVDAYCDEARSLGLPLPARSAFLHMVFCYRLHKVLDLLRKAFDRGFTKESTQSLVEMAVQLTRSVGIGGNVRAVRTPA